MKIIEKNTFKVDLSVAVIVIEFAMSTELMTLYLAHTNTFWVNIKFFRKLTTLPLALLKFVSGTQDQFGSVAVLIWHLMHEGV